MTNEELKKKILEIFEKAIGDWYEKDDGLFAEGYTPEEGDNRLKAFMADALIAAGIGDLKEHRIFAGKDGSIKQLYSGEEVEQIVKERDEYKHRAEVAEKALKHAVNVYIAHTETSSKKKWWYKYFLREAEKELAEEGKDEQS